MRIVFFLSGCIFLFFSINIRAQSFPPEKFQKILDTVNEPSRRLAYLDTLIQLTRNKDTDGFVSYSRQYIDIALSEKAYEKAIRKGINVFYYIREVQKRPDEALQLIEKLERYEPHIKDSFLLGSLYLKKGGAYYEKDFERAIDNYTEAIGKFGQKDSIHVADAYLFRAQSHSYLGNFVQAVHDYETATEYYTNLGDEDYVINAKNGISVIYEMNRFYEKAQKVQEDIITYAREHNKYRPVIITLYNQALRHRERGLTNIEEEKLLEAEALNKEKNEDELFLNILINSSLSMHYSKKENLVQAEKYFAAIEKQKKEFAKDDFLMQLYQSAKSALVALKGDTRQAIALLEKVHEYNLKSQNKDHLADIKKELADLHEKSGNIPAAYAMYKSHNVLKDSLFNVVKTNALSYYQTLYETERKEKEIVEKSTTITLLEKENELKKRILFFSISGLSLLFLTVFQYQNRKQLLRSKKQQELFSQQLLWSQEEERKRISKDLHDGLGQSLLLIKNRIVLSEDENTKNMVNNVIEEVRGISRALHPFQLEELGLTKALQNIVDQTDTNTDIFVSSEIDPIDGLTGPEKEVHIFRIFQESLSNIVKHAEAAAARVTVMKKENSIEIIIKDNGKGFDFSEKYNDFSSLGLKTLKERTKTLNGIMKVDSEKGKGTTLSFIIPTS